MQTKLNNDNNQRQTQQGEVIAFYGDLVSINPKDVAFHGSATEHIEVLSYVKEHQDNPHFTVMYPHAHGHSLHSGLIDEIKEINPHTQFVQVDSIEEFSDYYDNGSKTMDRELHPVESVKNLADQDVLFYDVKAREAKMEPTPVEIKKEYVKPTDISYNEMVKDVQTQFSSDMKLKGQEFLDKIGIDKKYNKDKDERMITLAKHQLHMEFTQNYTLPQAGKTAVESIEKVIPGNQAKSVKDGIELVHDLLGDTDRGDLRIEYDCKSLSECHIKGVYREHEDEKVLEKTQENNMSKESAILENNTTKSTDKVAFIDYQNEQNKPFDSTSKSQEILAKMDLPQRDEGMDYGMDDGMDYC